MKKKEEFGILDSVITIYNGSSLEESLSNDNQVLPHEIRHVSGIFGGNTSLLNEGYCALTQENSGRGHYDNEQLMAALFIETFGIDTMKEAYYTSDIENVLSNKVIEASGRDDNTIQDIYSLLEDTQRVLYRMGELGDDFRKDQDLMNQYENLYLKLSKYYEIINGKQMDTNSIANLIKDYSLGLNTSALLNDGEIISHLKYLRNGDLKIEIASKHDGDNIEYNSEYGMTQIPEPRYYRNVEVINNDKYSSLKRLCKIEDSSIDYLSR